MLYHNFTVESNQASELFIIQEIKKMIVTFDIKKVIAHFL